MMRPDAWADTHAKGSLAFPEDIEVGDLIYYDYDWCPVTVVDARGEHVFVTFTHRPGYDRSGRAEWKPYRRTKRARVRKQLQKEDGS